jgi:acetolactate synthase-1/2/3 large subunit
LIDIAKDVFIADIDCDIPFNVALPRCRDNEYRLSEQIPAIKEAIESCHRPLILAGGGVVAACASGKLGQYAQKSGIPVVTTLMGMGIVMGDGVNLLGMTGMYGNRVAVTALSQCDLLIAVGTRFSDRTIPDFNMFARSRMIIHCDIDPAEINKNLTADIAAVCGADEFFDALYELDISYNSDSYSIWNNQLAVLKAAHVIQLHEKRLSNWEIMRILNGFGIKRRDMVYVSDVGDFQTHAAREIEPQFERGFITSGGLGTMGCGLPSAIGATYAADACVKNIILMCGDGGFQMSMQELSTLKSARLPVKIFIFDNGALRMIKNAQNKCFNGRYVDSILNDNPDFELIGKAYGIKTCRLDVSRRDTLESDIGNILDAEQHMLVRCCV